MRKDKVDKQAQSVADHVKRFLDATNPRERVLLAKHIGLQAGLLENYSVYEARDNEMSWAAIGEVFGYSRQAAQQRFGGA